MVFLISLCVSCRSFWQAWTLLHTSDPHNGSALIGRCMQRGAPMDVRLVAICLTGSRCVAKHLPSNYIKVAHKQGKTGVRMRRLVLDEAPNHFQVTLVSSQMQRCVAVAVWMIGICTRLAAHSERVQRVRGAYGKNNTKVVERCDPALSLSSLVAGRNNPCSLLDSLRGISRKSEGLDGIDEQFASDTCKARHQNSPKFRQIQGVNRSRCSCWSSSWEGRSTTEHHRVFCSGKSPMESHLTFFPPVDPIPPPAVPPPPVVLSTDADAAEFEIEERPSDWVADMSHLISSSIDPGVVGPSSQHRDRPSRQDNSRHRNHGPPPCRNPLIAITL